MSQRILSAPKYRVTINQHLIGEILDRMQLTSSQRGVVVRGLNAIKLALSRAHDKPQDFGVTLKMLANQARSPQDPVLLYELLFILDDLGALSDVHEHGSYFGGRTGPKTEQAVRQFADAVCAEVEQGFFRI